MRRRWPISAGGGCGGARGRAQHASHSGSGAASSGGYQIEDVFSAGRARLILLWYRFKTKDVNNCFFILCMELPFHEFASLRRVCG